MMNTNCNCNCSCTTPTTPNDKEILQDICSRLAPTIIQLLYKKIKSEDICGEPIIKKVYPETIILAVTDAFTGQRLDYILSLCNTMYLPYKGTSLATRLSVGRMMRRNGLIVTFRDLEDRTWTLRYKGESISDEAWLDSDNWEAWDFDSLLEDISKVIQNIFVNINNYNDLKQIIYNSIREFLINYLQDEDFAALIRSIIEEILPNYVLAAVQEYFEGEGRDLIRQLIMELLPDALSEFLEDIHEAIRDNERVTANALARHELALQEIQNQLGIH